MSEYNTYAPLNERLVKFQEEIHTLYSNAVNDRLAELQEKAHKETTERLYGSHSALTQFENFKVTAGNARKAANLFELIEEIKDLHGENIEAIVKKGASRGFTEDESLVIYNMSRYTRAYENMMKQREETIKLLLAEATKV